MTNLVIYHYYMFFEVYTFMLTALNLIGSILFVILGFISYLRFLKIPNKDWREIALILSLIFIVFGLSSYIYFIISD